LVKKPITRRKLIARLFPPANGPQQPSGAGSGKITSSVWNFFKASDKEVKFAVGAEASEAILTLQT